MSAVWEAAHNAAQEICAGDALRLTNLAIAAAAQDSQRRGRKQRLNGSLLQGAVLELALTPLEKHEGRAIRWERLAELAREAAHLGLSAEGMHSWAAAYQRTSTTQKALGAYATHNSFAAALARITFAPLERKRVYRVIDPSVGAGNLLLAAVELNAKNLSQAELKRFLLSLEGVELDPRARELCCLLLWLAGSAAGVTLQQVAKRIRLGNALTMDWWSKREPYEVLLMNPPWESLRHQVNDDAGVERELTVARLNREEPGAAGLPPLFTAQGTGDRNLFKAFVELVPHLVCEGGRIGALLPAAFASDAGLTELRKRYLQQFEIARWTSYENRGGYFPIDSRYKFGLLAATRSNAGTRTLAVRGFAIEPDEVDAPHVALERQDIELIGRKYHIIPELSSERELGILRQVLRCGAPLFSRGPLGLVQYRREIDLSLGKSQFRHIESQKFRRTKGAEFSDVRGNTYVPLMEGRSVGAYDCFQKSWAGGSGRTASWLDNGSAPLAQCQPQYLTGAADAMPPRVALCDVTAATNTRTVIATRVPRTWRCGNTAPVLQFEGELQAFAGLAILNSLVFDWVARRLTSGLHLNKFVLEGMVWPSASTDTFALLAHAAWSICRSRPRGGLTGEETRAPPWETPRRRGTTPLPEFEAEVVVEVETARAFGLTKEQLVVMYDAGRSDRRGFWRYYSVRPRASEIVEEVLSRY